MAMLQSYTPIVAIFSIFNDGYCRMLACGLWLVPVVMIKQSVESCQ